MAGYDAEVNFLGRRNLPETRALAGFILSGFVFSLLGALLPAWGYDVSPDYAGAGRFFLVMVGGMLLSGTFVRRLVPRRTGARSLLVSGCATATLALAGLAALPEQSVWRFLGIFILGTSAGMLHAGLFEAVLPAYDRDAARAVNLAGIFFGAGSFAAPLVVAGAYYAYSVSTILLSLAVLPAIFFVVYLRTTYPPTGIVSHPKVMKQFRSVPAILFSMLLFFQFGNEWAVAGWLPLFLIHRLGESPSAALRMLAYYFAALTLGRVGVSYLLPRVNNWRLLAVSAGASLFGCSVLAATDNFLGASVSIGLIGLGFAAIYPLLAAWIGRRFPYYHPGFFNGIFSVALAGGMLAPWLYGELAGFLGMWVVVSLPAIGTFMVILLLGVIWIHDKVTGE